LHVDDAFVASSALRVGKKKCTSALTISERASAAAASLRGSLEAKNRRKGEKHWGAGEELQHHHNTKAVQ
jgi:hypothetical protein